MQKAVYRACAKLLSEGVDPLVDAELYRKALYALGNVHILKQEPDYVSALHVFLRARQRFPNSEIEGQLLINIARCYAEIRSSLKHAARIWDILRDESLLDNREVEFKWTKYYRICKPAWVITRGN